MDRDRDRRTTINQLIHANTESKRNFYAAAAQMENRAIKLLLKAYAQERAGFVGELEARTGSGDDGKAHSAYSPGFFQRGWLDLKSAMVVRRNRRHRLLLEELYQLETDTVALYAKATAASLPADLHAVVTRQAERVRIIHQRVGLLGEELERRIAVRLFNQDEDVEQSLARLQTMGIPPHEISVIPIERIAAYSTASTERARPRVTREAILTGGLLGLVAGGLLGLLYGSFHRAYFPELGGLLATTATGVLWEMSLHGALIGLVFSLIFSTLIASSAAETDAYLLDDSFQNGDTVVAVFADPRQIDKVERTIGLMHEHEIKPVAV
ncbi:MAG: DUF2383 domain-containing protein [Caldilineaceae bacterium]|nr:DUF2383 domain-containing protein [Caldilineaceae bacterium]